MPLAAISYAIRPGHEDDIAAIFAGFQRVGGPGVRDATGAEAGRILSTALFLRDDLMVRFIEYEGDLDAIARHMAATPGVQEVERRLKPYLSAPRETSTVEGFAATFRASLLRCISHLSVRDA